MANEKPTGILQILHSIFRVKKEDKDQIPRSGIKSSVNNWRACHRLTVLIYIPIFFALLFIIDRADPREGGLLFWPAYITKFVFDYPLLPTLGDRHINLLLFDQKLRDIAFVGNEILLFGLTLLWLWLIPRYERNNPIKYHPCPYEDCNDSIGIYVNWQCNRCKQFQGAPRYICDPCIHCKRHLETAFCEHCHEEFKI